MRAAALQTLGAVGCHMLVRLGSCTVRVAGFAGRAWSMTGYGRVGGRRQSAAVRPRRPCEFATQRRGASGSGFWSAARLVAVGTAVNRLK